MEIFRRKPLIELTLEYNSKLATMLFSERVALPNSRYEMGIFPTLCGLLSIRNEFIEIGNGKK